MGLISSATEYAYSLLEGLPAEFVYHNIRHTKYVALNCKIIGKAEQLDNASMEIVEIAALFHDTGYTVSYPYHEMESRKIVGEFLKSNGCSTSMIYRVMDCICATRYPSYPGDAAEKVICDADLSHLAAKEFLELNELLRNEWNLILKKNISSKEHLEGTLRFLDSHSYYTSYGKDILDVGKQKNIRRVKELLVSG
jgi:predicted metal-dependent HD superfamily phosphohydrolase